MKDRAMEIATWAVELQNKVAKLEAVNTALLEACKEFVRKVDCGQARSTRSYMQMKAAIAKAEEVTE